MTLHHISLHFPPSKFDAVLAFYLASLAPLGYRELSRPAARVVGIGVPVTGPDFWIHGHRSESSEDDQQREKVHVAFRAGDQDQVHVFYTAALAAGGVCNGPPGPRPEYSSEYYGAFVLDPAGNNIEACL
ncbi:hypothetical protein VTN00DRAFT_1491 [Thermoascus crustaceus]|uniref:uncharacterized protein n=1 Tax=Thermoascus crustaceus TaxID=5088 RepID=UPI003742764F